MRSIVIGLALVIGLSACEGPAGPMGPAGPAGPGHRMMLTTIVTGDGGAIVLFPPAVGTNPAQPPALTCFVSSTGSTTWLVVADGYTETTAYCGLIFAAGRWTAVMNQAVPGFTAAFIVVY